MSQQQLKISKNSQSAAVSSNEVGREQQTKSNQDQHLKQTPQNLSKGKSENQTFQKKLNRRDLNLIPPSAAIVQSVQADPYSSNNEHTINRSGYVLTLNSTQNRNNKTTGWENMAQQSRVTTVKHEKGLPNGTIMQCLKQFQRSKQQRQGHHQPPPEQSNSNQTSTKPGITLSSVTPIASQNVANMPVSTKSNKSQKSTKTRTQIANNASMAAEAHAQRRQNFTCTTTTKGSLRLTKKSPSNGREGGQNANHQMVNQTGRGMGAHQQPRSNERSSNAKHHHGHQTGQNIQTVKNARGSTSQQHNTASAVNEKNNRQQLNKTSKKQQHQDRGTNHQPEKMLNDMDFESKFAMLMRIREERSNESKPELINDSHKMILMTQSNPYDPVKLISPNTTTNRQSSQETKLLTLKNFMPAKQVNSNEVTPKYLKCKLGNEKQSLNPDPKRDDSNEMRNPKIQSKSQISTHKIIRQKDQQVVYGTAGSSPDKNRLVNTTKSLSNNSRQKYSTQQQPQQQSSNLASTIQKNVKPQSITTKGGQQHISLKQKSGAPSHQKPTAPQMRYSVPPDTKGQTNVTNLNTQAQQAQVQSSSSALNGSSELQKRFTRGEIGSHHEASVSSGKANKSFQFGHNTALMSCSSGGDSSNPPQPVRRRSSSGKNGKQQIKISQIQNVNPVVIQPGTSTSAGLQQNDDSSVVNLKKQVPQSTTNNQKSGKRFTFTLNSKNDHNQKASRPNKHSNNNAVAYGGTSVTPSAGAGGGPVSQSTAGQGGKQLAANIGQHKSLTKGGGVMGSGEHDSASTSGQVTMPVGASMQQQAAAKSASKTKSVSAKKGKSQGVQGQAPHSHQTTAGAGKNLTFENTNKVATGAKLSGQKEGQRQYPAKGGQTPEEMWYEGSHRSSALPSTATQQPVSSKNEHGPTTYSIPIHSGSGSGGGLSSQTETNLNNLMEQKERVHKASLDDSTPNDSIIVNQQKHHHPPLDKSKKDARRKGGPSQHHQKNLSGDYNNMSGSEVLVQRDSVAEADQESSHDDTAAELVVKTSRDQLLIQMRESGNLGKQTSEEYRRLADEIQVKDNLIQQLYQALGRKDEQLNALTKNCEHLSSSLKMRDEKRDRSQQAIKETLKNLEEKLHMFTAQSNQNQGGLREINQSPCEPMRLIQQMSGGGGGSTTPQIMIAGLAAGNGSHATTRVVKPDANTTPTLSKHRMEPFNLNFQHSQQQHRPTSSTLLSVPNSKHGAGHYDATNRRPSQISEIDSLVTVAEYMGTQYGDGSKYDMSAAKKDQQLLVGEGTIGSLASEIQLINSKNGAGHVEGQFLLGEKVNFPVFQKLAASDDADDMGELTSLSEMEMSNVHDASLDQLERDLMISQHKLQEQSQKAVAFVKTQQNNFIDLKANMQAANQKHVIFETTEEAEDDIAQLVPKKGSSSHMSNTYKLNMQKISRDMRQSEQVMVADTNRAEESLEKGHSSHDNQYQSDMFKSSSLVNKSGSHLSNQNMMSKTMSKNKMKLKLAAEILGLKKDQMMQQSNANQAREEEKANMESSAQNKNDSKEIRGIAAAKKKIQLPLKISKGSDSNRIVLQNKSQERGTNSNNSANGQQNQVFNSVAIRNLKNKNLGDVEPQRQSSTRVQIQTQHSSNQHQLSHPTKSPQSRQGAVQVQGQGNMLSNRLTAKSSHQQQPNVQKIEKLTANQLLLVQKLQHGHKNANGANLLEENKNETGVQRKERR